MRVYAGMILKNSEIKSVVFNLQNLRSRDDIGGEAFGAILNGYNAARRSHGCGTLGTRKSHDCE